MINNIHFIATLSCGKPLLLDKNGTLRAVTWLERMVRWVRSTEAYTEDLKVEDYLINHLQNSTEKSPLLTALTKFVKGTTKTSKAFKRLDAYIFAEKCRQQFPSISLQTLIDDSGSPTDLFHFLKANAMHRVIPKANACHTSCALLITDSEVFIRSPQGTSFLETADDVTLILKHIHEADPDHELMVTLRNLLQNRESSVEEIQQIREKLHTHSYFYIPLSTLQRDEKGVLISSAYLADGIEDFHHSKWDMLRPNFRETTTREHPSYKLRIVTRLPSYALGKSRWEKIVLFFKNIFDFRAHGHSWIELVEPVFQNDAFIKEQNVYSVGYYFHPLNRYKRLESADPMSYMPIPQEQLNIEETELSPDQFKKAYFYITEVQKIAKLPGRNLSSEPNSDLMDKEDFNRICYLYKSSFKGSCLSFCTALKTIITEQKCDYRDGLRKTLYPKALSSKLEHCFDKIIEKIPLIKHLIRLPRFLLRVELPAGIHRNKTPESVIRRNRQMKSSV